MVPSRFTFSFGSECKGTGGGGAGRGNVPDWLALQLPGGSGAEGVGDTSPLVRFSGSVIVDVSNTGIEMIGRAFEPGFGGGNAGALAKFTGGGGAQRVGCVASTDLPLTNGGGGAERCGTPPFNAAVSCTVGCT